MDFSVGFPGGSEVKASACSAGDLGSIPGLGRSPGEGNGNPLQYSCLENPMGGAARWATVHGVAKSRTRLSDFTFTFTYQSWFPLFFCIVHLRRPSYHSLLFSGTLNSVEYIFTFLPCLSLLLIHVPILHTSLPLSLQKVETAECREQMDQLFAFEFQTLALAKTKYLEEDRKCQKRSFLSSFQTRQRIPWLW